MKTDDEPPPNISSKRGRSLLYVRILKEKNVFVGEKRNRKPQVTYHYQYSRGRGKTLRFEGNSLSNETAVLDLLGKEIKEHFEEEGINPRTDNVELEIDYQTRVNTYNNGKLVNSLEYPDTVRIGKVYQNLERRFTD